MPLSISDLIFSEQVNLGLHKTLAEIKRSNHSIRNRLLSIQHDAAFVEQVATIYEKPLVANERCGNWYIDPKKKKTAVYFKSTDGHTGVWKFSLRRLNFHLLEIIGKFDGCIIVDSTRNGKSMPDALSKTVPIWCAVLNQYLFPENPETHKLFVPDKVISRSEHDQISSLLPSFVITLEALNVSQTVLRKVIHKPLRTFWITPNECIGKDILLCSEFHPIICCTASVRATEELSDLWYIQGAGDDTENWSLGLTPNIFWTHKEKLLSTSEFELPELIKQFVAEYKLPIDPKVHCIKPTSCLFIGTNNMIDTLSKMNNTCTIILLSKKANMKIFDNKIVLGIGEHKAGSRNLRRSLPMIIDFVTSNLSKFKLSDDREQGISQIIISCESGMEYSIGAALAILCLFFNEEGGLLDQPVNRETINKDFIRKKLSWISISIPRANPSRATLQSVNSFLMDR